MSQCPGIHSDSAGQAPACASCPNSTYCQQKTDNTHAHKSQIARNVDGKKILAVMSGKGGVGKSTVCMMIASALKSCCVLDFDVSGPSIAKMSGTEDEIITNVRDKFVPVHMKGTDMGVVSAYHANDGKRLEYLDDSSFINEFLLDVLKNCDFTAYTYIVIDTPPGITDEHLFISNYLKMSCVLVTTPSVLSMNDLTRQIDFCEKARIGVLGVIENMKEFVCECGCRVPMGTLSVERECMARNIRYLGGMECTKMVGMHADGGLIYDGLFTDIAQNIQAELDE